MSDQRLAIRRGRHVGWWTEWRSPRGRRFMLTWWPTKSLASMVARLWARVIRRVGGREVMIEERDVIGSVAHPLIRGSDSEGGSS